MRLDFIVYHSHILSCVLYRGVQLTEMILLDNMIGLQLTVLYTHYKCGACSGRTEEGLSN